MSGGIVHGRGDCGEKDCWVSAVKNAGPQEALDGADKEGEGTVFR